MKFKIPVIQFSYVLLWQIFVIAFFILFVVTSCISTYMFFKLKNEVASSAISVEFKVKTIDTKQMEEVVLGLEKKERMFKENLLNESGVDDPSGTEDIITEDITIEDVSKTDN